MKDTVCLICIRLLGSIQLGSLRKRGGLHLKENRYAHSLCISFYSGDS